MAVAAEVPFRRRSVPNQRAATIPIITAIIATTMPAWGSMQGMAAIMAVALRYETFHVFFTSPEFTTICNISRQDRTEQLLA